MKLRTEMVGPDSTSVGPYPAARENDDGQDYLHDAAAAHAFLLAIHEQSPRIRIKLHERALTIMREWGFDSGEDA